MKMKVKNKAGISKTKQSNNKLQKKKIMKKGLSKNVIPRHKKLKKEDVNFCNDSADESNDDIEAEETLDNLSSKDHKKDLAKLKETDPEFYKFLQQNDETLLDFNLEDSDSDEEDSDEEEKFHKPPDKLEIDSDEEDYEGDDKGALAGGPGQLVSLKMVASWQEQLQTDKTVKTIASVIKAFHAALQSVSKDDTETESPEYKVVGSAVFNAVVQLCVLDLQPALVTFLKLPTERRQFIKAQPAKSKGWTKVKGSLKEYFTDLLKLLGAVTSEHILCVMLKHLHQMSSFLLLFHHQKIKIFLRRLVTLWSEADEEAVRILAFLCILRITISQQRTWLDPVLKLMYNAYIMNSKFVSPTTLPGINFMRRSLTELLSLDPAVTYQHAFLYIRQLAIHLRNAVTIHKKESIQAVYNWQYMNSLKLWTDMLCMTHGKPQLQPLLYPLVQVIIGCIKLVTTPKCFPIRFHCCKMLISLSRATGTYIPILPFILEVLSLTDFDKGHKKVSMKPMDFTCILKLSDSDQLENAFKDAAIELVYMLTLESLSAESHRLSFPDMTLLPILHLKNFLKTSKMHKYVQKLRGALNKIEENVTYIENERKKLTFTLTDKKAIDAWERSTLAKGTPLNTFFNSLQKIYMLKEAKRATDNEKLGEFRLPQLKKGEKRRTRDDLEPEVKMPSSDEDSEDEMSLLRLEGETCVKKAEKPKKKKTKTEIKENGKKNREQEDSNVDKVDSEDDDDIVDHGDEVVDFEMSDVD